MGRPRVGVDKLHYAKLTQDDSSGAEYDSAVSVENVTNISLNFNTEFSTFFADDGPRESYTQMGEVEAAITVADLTGEQYAELLGADQDDDGIVDLKTTDSPPEVAIGFRSRKSNGEYRYVWLMKGTFGVPDSEYQTQEGSINFQPQTINGRFVARTYDNKVFRRLDSDDESYDEDDWNKLEDDWFDEGPDVEPTDKNS